MTLSFTSLRNGAPDQADRHYPQHSMQGEEAVLPAEIDGWQDGQFLREQREQLHRTHRWVAAAIIMAGFALFCALTASEHGAVGTMFFLSAMLFMIFGADKGTDNTVNAFKQLINERRALEVENARLQVRLYRLALDFPRGEERGAAGDREAASPAADVVFINPPRRVH